MATAVKNLWVCAYDLHYPFVDWPTFNAMLAFIKENKKSIAGFVWGGDQHSNDEISHHTKGKAIYRPTGEYKRNTEGFDRRCLTPIENLLADDVTKIWLEGNHDHFVDQLIAEQPELKGSLERPLLLDIEARGWKYFACGTRFRLGKLSIIHGEQLSGVGNQNSAFHAKKATDIYAGSVLYGHTHSPQSYTRVLPYDVTQKWQATCSPILGAVNPTYLRNSQSSWTNGFTVVETQTNGNFNVYSIVVVNGRFSFAGKLYDGRER